MFQRAIEFLKEVRAEMGKITWPTRQELVESTYVVIITVLVITAFIAVVDQIFSFLLKTLIRAA